MQQIELLLGDRHPIRVDGAWLVGGDGHVSRLAFMGGDDPAALSVGFVADVRWVRMHFQPWSRRTKTSVIQAPAHSSRAPNRLRDLSCDLARPHPQIPARWLAAARPPLHVRWDSGTARVWLDSPFHRDRSRKGRFALLPTRNHRLFRHAASLVVTLALGVAACSTGSSAAATVGGTQITAAEVDQVYARRAEAPGLASELAGEESDPNLRASVLTTLIRSEILRQAAEDRDVEVSDDEIAERREVLVESAGGQEALDQLIADSNISDEELEANLVDQAIQAEIGEQLAPEVTDEDVRKEFDEDPQGQYGEKVEVRHILTQTEDEAEEAMRRVESGEEFSEVAQEMSQDPGSAANGGELGPLARGSTVEAFDEAAFSADVGELVGPVETEFGFHVLEVTDEVPAAEFADVQDEIRTQLEETSRSQTFSEYITNFVSELEVEVDPEYGTWDAQSVSVVPPQASESPTNAPLPSGSELPTEIPTDLELPTEIPTG